jgi:N-formylglutamate deformylase
MTDIFNFTPGDAPLLISVPHAGTALAPGLAERLAPHAAGLLDTDWFVDRLYDFAGDLGIGLIKANYSRYVIDLNRPIDGTPLYPGQTESGLTPTTSFDGLAIYRKGSAPDGTEIQDRIVTYWQPYHQKLKTELDRLRQRHGRVLLWDAHSIKARVPRFFAGRLPDLNFGNADGRSCAPEFAANLLRLTQNDGNFSTVLNGRFKGGYITRHYGDPAQGIEAMQLEIAQEIYMTEEPAEFKVEKARVLQKLLKQLLSSCLKSA